MFWVFCFSALFHNLSLSFSKKISTFIWKKKTTERFLPPPTRFSNQRKKAYRNNAFCSCCCIHYNFYFCCLYHVWYMYLEAIASLLLLMLLHKLFSSYCDQCLVWTDWRLSERQLSRERMPWKKSLCLTL